MRALAILAAFGCASSPAPRPDPAPPAAAPLAVRITIDDLAAGGHALAVRTAAESALTTLPFTMPVSTGGDIELLIQLADLTVSADTTCTLKILVLAHPASSILGIATATATVQGWGPEALSDCLTGVATSLFRTKLAPLLEERHASAQP